MLVQFQCQKCGCEILSNYDSYFVCPSSEHGLEIIASCPKCYVEGNTECGQCGAKLKFHDGKSDHEAAKDGMMF